MNKAYSALLNGARPGKALVDGSANFFVGECRDDTLDLPPVAESNDVSSITALLGARSRLQPGIVAKAIDQVRGLGKRKATGNEWRVHAFSLTRKLFPDGRQCWSTNRSP